MGHCSDRCHLGLADTGHPSVTPSATGGLCIRIGTGSPTAARGAARRARSSGSSSGRSVFFVFDIDALQVLLDKTLDWGRGGIGLESGQDDIPMLQHLIINR